MYVVDNFFVVIIVYDLIISVLFSKNVGKIIFFGFLGMWLLDNDCLVRYCLFDFDIIKVINVLILGGIDGFFLGYGFFSWENKGVWFG